MNLLDHTLNSDKKGFMGITGLTITKSLLMNALDL